MVRYNKKKVLKWVVILVIIFPVINFFIPSQGLPTSYRHELASITNTSDVEYIREVYNMIHEKFNSEERCWKNYYWKNYLVRGSSIFKEEGECLPCHVQNNLLHASLLHRFDRSQLVSVGGICWDVPMFHVYTQVRLADGNYINVDQWGSHWKVDFGDTIHNTPEVCEK